MDDDPKRTRAPPTARHGTEPAKASPPIGRDRRAVRTVDLTDDDIATIEASEMAPGFEHSTTSEHGPRIRLGKGAGTACVLASIGSLAGVICRAAGRQNR